jgi:hypothetical protein
MDGVVLSKTESMNALVRHFSNIFGTYDLGHFVSKNPHSVIDINVGRGINRLALNKASGLDTVPGEWLKHPDIFVTLENVFKFCVNTQWVPDFWMRSKLIVLSKVKSNTPNVNDTRPICILP